MTVICFIADDDHSVANIDENRDTTQKITYNHIGQTTSVMQPGTQYNYTYTRYGEPLAEEQTLGTRHILTRHYDSYGRDAGTLLQHGDRKKTLLHSLIGYTDNGQISHVTPDQTGPGKPVGYHYEPGTNLLAKLTLPNGVSRAISYEEHRDLPNLITYTGKPELIDGLQHYSPGAKLLSFNRHNPGNLVVRHQHSDALGRPVTRTRQIGTGTAREDQYTYNSRGELTGAQQGVTLYNYTYDNIGNREQSSEAEPTHYITNGLNQYTDINGDKPVYDLDGNQTNVRTSTRNWRINYNDQGRPEHITSEDGTTQVQCTYDHMGRRVRKTVSRQGRVVKDHTFAYRDYLQVAVFDILNNGAPVHTILWDPSEPVATRPLSITTADGQTHYYGWDLNKNVTELFDEAGKLAATYDYSPYGELLTQPAEGIGKDNPFRYSSEYHDEELGLIYYNYRHYNPADGRWISRDPIHEQGGWNLYAFVGNNCINRKDILGLAHTVKVTKCTITINLDIAIYPAPGDGVTDAELQKVAKEIKESIEKEWNGLKKGCCSVVVKANVEVQKRKSSWLYRRCNPSENNIEISSDPACRSEVRGGKDGTWGSEADPWVYAHEAGHLMGLPDDYSETKLPDGSPITTPNPGHEGHMMGEPGGSVDQHEIDDILKNIECPCKK